MPPYLVEKFTILEILRQKKTLPKVTALSATDMVVGGGAACVCKTIVDRSARVISYAN